MGKMVSLVEREEDRVRGHRTGERSDSQPDEVALTPGRLQYVAERAT